MDVDPGARAGVPGSWQPETAGAPRPALLEPAAPTDPGDGPTLSTSRLLLRRWRLADRAPFARLNADPAVMEFFPQRLSRAESDHFSRFGDSLFERYGYGLWAVERLDSPAFIGFVGLSAVEADDPLLQSPFPFAPTVEVGWRLAKQAWGHGFATEAASACLAFGFETAGLAEIVSFTAASNLRSRRVMEKLKMHRDPADDFDHPRLARGDRLLRHVLYRLRRDEWEAFDGDRSGYTGCQEVLWR